MERERCPAAEMGCRRSETQRLDYWARKAFYGFLSESVLISGCGIHRRETQIQLNNIRNCTPKSGVYFGLKWKQKMPEFCSRKSMQYCLYMRSRLSINKPCSWKCYTTGAYSPYGKGLQNGMRYLAVFLCHSSQKQIAPPPEYLCFSFGVIRAIGRPANR